MWVAFAKATHIFQQKKKKKNKNKKKKKKKKKLWTR